MGVPKFYRWIVERYPCLYDVVDNDRIPPFDNLYLDMNGIIHNCSHGDDDAFDPSPISTNKVFEDICLYVDYLFCIIKPRKVFFLAVDGVAPRAKMNQQRARRFMSAKNTETVVKNKEILEDMFDSNCITPGTKFMAELHEYIKYFIAMKISTNPLWRGLRIYFSGHNCPGEGEHKIMDFIRSERLQKNYNPNTRHCLYGLDADLIMLSLCSHEAYFSLLREKVVFGRRRPKESKNNTRCNAKLITFNLLHISLLREYIDCEFSSIQDKLSFNYDLESVIDDWVLMGLLVGNDFIPHLPDIHIHDDGLSLLYRTYISVLPEIDGYLNEAGVLNLKRFEVFLKRLSSHDRKIFVDRMSDQKYLASKRSIDPNEHKESSSLQCGNRMLRGAFDTDSEEDIESEVNKLVEEMKNKIPSASNVFCIKEFADVESDVDLNENRMSQLYCTERDSYADSDSDEFENDVDAIWSPSIDRAFRDYKRNYYHEKMNYANISKEDLRAQAEGYVRALQWNLHYYYHGCCSWNWFYEHHYAPYVSDISDFHNVNMDFELSSPFSPFEQLMAVLPAASGQCLPPVLRYLMTDDNSPIIDYFPSDFKTDLNGKRNDWEAVVLLPFVNEKRLLDAIAPKLPYLTEEERKRNTNGPHSLFTTDVNHPYELRPIGLEMFSLPTVLNCIARCEKIDINEFRISGDRVVHGLLKTVMIDEFDPFYPSMKHLPYSASLRYANVRVFDKLSLKLSMVLKVLERPEFNKDILSIANDLINEDVYFNWPILKKAQAKEIWTQYSKYSKDANGVKAENLTASEIELLEKIYLSDSSFRELIQRGIDADGQKTIVLVKPFIGTKLVFSDAESSSGACYKEVQIYAEDDKLIPIPLSLIIQDRSQKLCKTDPIRLIDQCPVGTEGFLLAKGSDLYGRKAVIMNFGDRLAKCYLPVSPVDFSELRREYDNGISWLNVSTIVANLNQVSRKAVNNITASVFLYEARQKLTDHKVSSGAARINIGLQIKFSTRELAVPGFARRINGRWFYSQKTLTILADYWQRFPEVFNELSKASSCEIFEDNIWKYLSAEEKVRRREELCSYLRSLPSSSIPPVNDDYEYADDSFIERVEEISDIEKNGGFSVITVNFTPENFFKPELHFDDPFMIDGSVKFRLFDRVVFVKRPQDVPVGNYGVVVGISKNNERQDSCELDVLFDSPFFGGKVYSGGRRAGGARLSSHTLINLSHNERMMKDAKQMPVSYSPTVPIVLTRNSNHPSVGKCLEYHSSAFFAQQEKKEIGKESFTGKFDLHGAKYGQNASTGFDGQHFIGSIGRAAKPPHLEGRRTAAFSKEFQQTSLRNTGKFDTHVQNNVGPLSSWSPMNELFVNKFSNKFHSNQLSNASLGVRASGPAPMRFYRQIRPAEQKFCDSEESHPNFSRNRDRFFRRNEKVDSVPAWSKNMTPTQVMRNTLKTQELIESQDAIPRLNQICVNRAKISTKQPSSNNELNEKGNNSAEISDDSQPLTSLVPTVKSGHKRGSRVVANFSFSNASQFSNR